MAGQHYDARGERPPRRAGRGDGMRGDRAAIPNPRLTPGAFRRKRTSRAAAAHPLPPQVDKCSHSA